jgi:hypothetical protein
MFVVTPVAPIGTVINHFIRASCCRLLVSSEVFLAINTIESRVPDLELGAIIDLDGKPDRKLSVGERWTKWRAWSKGSMAFGLPSNLSS